MENYKKLLEQVREWDEQAWVYVKAIDKLYITGFCTLGDILYGRRNKSVVEALRPVAKKNPALLAGFNKIIGGLVTIYR